MPAIIITSPRGTRAAWDAGLFDALVLSVHTLGGGEALSAADRTLLTVAALKFWPDNSVVTMVDRVLSVEDTIAAGGRGTAKAMLAERDLDRHLTDALLRPVVFSSTLRTFSDDELDRLIEAAVTGYIDSMQDQAARKERTGTVLDDPLPF